MVELFIGPMRSGKSAFMSEKLVRAVIAKKRAVLVRMGHDTRGFVSRSDKTPASEKSYDIYNLPCAFGEAPSKDALDEIFQYDVVAFDEVQFFNEAWIVSALTDPRTLGKRVYMAGLQANRNQKMFPTVVAVLPYADKVRFFTAVCDFCGGDDAAFTCVRDPALEDLPEDSPLLVGDEAYVVTDRKCLLARLRGRKERLDGKKV